MGRRVALALLAVVGLLAVCGPVESAPRAPGPVAAHVARTIIDPAHVTSAALGDLATVSPCDLVDARALPKPYGVGVLIVAANLDDCALSVPKPGGAPVLAAVGMVEKLTKPVTRTKSRAGGLRIAKVRDDATRCDELLVFADGIGLHATVRPSGGKRSGLCDLATALLDQVVKAVTHGGVRHRHYPAYSFAALAACDLLTPADVGLAGFGPLRPSGLFPAGHRCRYVDSEGARIELDFGVRDAGIWDPQWTDARLGSRESVVIANPRAELATCAVSTMWLVLAGGGSPGTRESATLTVRAPDGSPTPCAQAQRVAAAVWQKLPWPPA